MYRLRNHFSKMSSFCDIYPYTLLKLLHRVSLRFYILFTILLVKKKKNSIHRITEKKLLQTELLSIEVLSTLTLGSLVKDKTIYIYLVSHHGLLTDFLVYCRYIESIYFTFFFNQISSYFLYYQIIFILLFSHLYICFFIILYLFIFFFQ